ncbi:hypothetical protein V8C86DRAFT_1291009 [Haematococcus lacustris]
MKGSAKQARLSAVQCTASDDWCLKVHSQRGSVPARAHQAGLSAKLCTAGGDQCWNVHNSDHSSACAQAVVQKDEWMRANTQLQMTVSELHEQLSYERAIVEAHKKKLEELEAAHSSREKDWHDLAAKWRKYEADANAENARLLGELAHFQKSTSIPKPATPLPEEEPQLRPETQFKAQVELPKAEEYIHPHPKDPPPASTHGPASHLTPGQHGALGGHGQGEHMQQQQQQQPPPQPHLLPHGMAASHVDGHSLHGGVHRDLAAEGAHRPAAPNPLEYHHGDAYPPAGDWEGGGHHYNEHLDPLDHVGRPSRGAARGLGLWFWDGR